MSGEARLLYRKLLVPLSGTPCGQVALAVAVQLATRWRAHLAAVIVRVDAASVAPLAGEGLSGAMIEDMMAATEREGTARAQGLEGLFHTAILKGGIALGGPGTGTGPATASLTVMTGRDEEIIPGLARLSDMTVLPHPDQNEEPGANGALHAVLFESGRPVLIAPKQQPQTLGRRCCVAWNGTTESSAALWAILPFLRQADAVRLLHAGEYQRRGPGASEVLAYLKMHGVTADVAEFQPINRDVGAGLLAAAGAFGADLVGMGAYSHSRLRQMILGGVTRHVLSQAAMPVLMAH
jgi:nucleotide-binding universal stress UspA family protein